MVSVESDSDTSQHIRDSDIDTSQLMMRGRGDGDGGLDDDDDSGVKTNPDDSDVIITNDNIPDSDFDDFDSNDEDPSMDGEVGDTAGSQDNEIHEIYLVQDSKQTRVLGRNKQLKYTYMNLTNTLCQVNVAPSMITLPTCTMNLASSMVTSSTYTTSRKMDGGWESAITQLESSQLPMWSQYRDLIFTHPP